MLPDDPLPPLRLKIDEQALVGNWRSLGRLSGRARAGAAVKADAYGLGARRVASALARAGCEDFFVAHWIEAAELMGLVDPSRLAVLHGPQSLSDARYARQSGVRPVINSLHQARIWTEAGGGLCDIMVDTGMNRLGLALDELGDPVVSGLEVDVLHSHLASPDEQSPQNTIQLGLWNQARDQIAHRRAALAGTAGIALGADYHGDLTRPGIGLYGGVPCESLQGAITDVVRLEAQVIQVRELAPGDSVGYNATFRAAKAMRVGTVGLGYADGYVRSWSNAGTLFAGDKPLAVLGRVSMDLVVVDLGQANEVGEGDWLAVEYQLPAAARKSGLSQYELLTLLGRRFAR